jgi:hypothetical protein
MPPAEIEPDILASERPKTLALNRGATGIVNFREETFRMKQSENKYVVRRNMYSEKKYLQREEICTVRKNMYSEKKYVQ